MAAGLAQAFSAPAAPSSQQGRAPAPAPTTLPLALQQVADLNRQLASTNSAAPISQFLSSGKRDKSLESTTPDIEYMNGIPTLKGRVLIHPLSYMNAKAEEANKK